MPDVVQNSWGVNEGFSGYVDCDSRWWAVIDNCEAAGVVITWSAGNEGSGAGTLRSPADRATTRVQRFSVGAVDATNYAFPYPIASFSSRGPTSCAGVLGAAEDQAGDLGARRPVYSSVPTGYGYKDGTSMAGPHVAGVVALMRQANPDLSVNTIKRILMNTARDLGAAGEDNTYGWGMVDAYAAVDSAMAGFGTLTGVVTNASFNDLPLANVAVEVPALGFRFRTGGRRLYSGRVAPGTQRRRTSSLPGFVARRRTWSRSSSGQPTVLDVASSTSPGPTITDVSQPLATPDTQGPYAIAAQIDRPEHGRGRHVLHVRVGAGAWQEIPMTGSGGIFAAAIAGQPANTSIAYYVTAEDGAGFTSADPAGAPAVTYALVVTEPAYAQDAESDGVPAWQLGAAGDAADTGIWVRADPVGTVYNGAPLQTEDDHTPAPGVACYVTGNGAVGGGFSDAGRRPRLHHPDHAGLRPRRLRPRLRHLLALVRRGRQLHGRRLRGRGLERRRRHLGRPRGGPHQPELLAAGRRRARQPGRRRLRADQPGQGPLPGLRPEHAGPGGGRDRRLRDRDLHRGAVDARSTATSWPRRRCASPPTSPTPSTPRPPSPSRCRARATSSSRSTPSTAAAWPCWSTAPCPPARTARPGPAATTAAGRWRRARTSTG